MKVLEIVAVLVGAAASALIWWNIRRIRTARRAAAIPMRVREEVLLAIDQTGRVAGTRALLLRIVDGPTLDPYSKVHGTPRLPPGMVLPASLEHTGRFLVQVRLHSPPLSEVWADLIVLLFEGSELPVVACSGGRAQPLSQASSTACQRADGQGIAFLWLPVEESPADAERSSPYAPSSLCSLVPEVNRLLSTCGDAPERVLPYVLIPGITTHEIDTIHVCLMGGDPELIQNQHAAKCDVCSKEITFLLHIGDFLEIGGDAPVVYVYGCNQHPEELKAYVDSH